MQDFERLGVFTVFEAFHDGGNVFFDSLVRVVFLIPLSFVMCGLSGRVVV